MYAPLSKDSGHKKWAKSNDPCATFRISQVKFLAKNFADVESGPNNYILFASGEARIEKYLFCRGFKKRPRPTAEGNI